jgi:hypothetical protein
MNANQLIKNVYAFRCIGPKEHLREEYIDLSNKLNADPYNMRLLTRMRRMEEVKDERSIINLMPTAGLNDFLDKYWAGSAYTASWFMGLINDTAYTGIVAGDTMASHGGWTEDQNYASATRPAVSFSAASAGVKTTSSTVNFSMNATTNLKGAFVVTNSTKGGTTGILASEGLFIQGDWAQINGNTLQVTFSSTLTSA